MNTDTNLLNQKINGLKRDIESLKLEYVYLQADISSKRDISQRIHRLLTAKEDELNLLMQGQMIMGDL